MKNNSLILIVAVLFCSALVLSIDLQRAYAFSLTTYSTAMTTTNAIALKDGETRFAIASGPATDQVEVRVQSTKALVATIASIVDPVFGFVVGTQPNRAYFIGGASGNTVYEIDLTNAVLLRSASTGCSATFQGHYIDYTAGMLWCSTGANLINRFSIASFSVVFTSTTTNAGATPCTGQEALSYDSATDTMFIGCSGGANNLVSIIGITTSGTPDFAVAYSTTVSGIAFNNRESNLAVCASGAVTPRIYNYSASTGFTLWKAIGTTSDTCSSNEYSGRMVYDRQSDRFFKMNGNTQFAIFDATTGDNLITTVIPNNGGMILVASNDLAVGNSGVSGGFGTYWFADLTGIPLGSNGESSGGGGSGIDCTLPENEFILTCRLGGDGSLGGAGTFIVGTTNGTTGLVPIMCSVGLVDCEANPDVATNGAGYLIVGIAIAVWVGVMWVASRGDLSSIPTFLWFIGALLIVGAFTVAGVIDVVFFIVTIIFVCALAAAKAKGLLGGGF